VLRAAFAMRMSWHDLLFAHWPADPARLRSLVPPALELDLFDGVAWLGVVPFRMTRVGPRILPPIPFVHAFCELNVRTYVVRRGRPGVWFFALDAANQLAVRVARRCFHLPYFDARMACRADGDAIEYRSERTHEGAPPARLDARYAPTGPVVHAAPGSLDAFLTDRLRLFSTAPDGGVRRVEVEHGPWPLQPASVELRANTMAASLGFDLAEPPAVVRFVRRLDVISRPMVRDDA
jgi:uncharacterized protein YqjF (DUF2071 family)